jgi:hypothetical protein
MGYSRSILHENKIVGIVYKYTSPSGKSYIGQTTNEGNRRRTWFCMKRRYAGAAIESARKKYGPENFEYEVLFRHSFSTFEEATKVLDKVEMYYIGIYDTLNSGYNNTVGGLCPEKGIKTKLGDRIINRESAIYRANKRRYREHHTKKEIALLRKDTNRKNGRWPKILQFDLNGSLLHIFNSTGEAIESLGKGSTRNIRRACKTLGTYYGYNWRFAEDGLVMRVKPKRIYKKEQFIHSYKPIIRYDRKMNYIDEFESITAAAMALGIPYTSCIGACLAGKIPTAHNYKWRYK